MPESATRHLKVFLCHSSGDKPTVRDLYRRLNAEGWIDAWLDEMKLLPGQDWGMEIEKAVEETDIVIVCVSTRSIDKEGYIQKELRFVLNIADEKPEGSIYVIPLRLDDCVIPRRLRAWQWVNYFPEDQRQIAYQRLLESLKLRAEKLGVSGSETAVFRSFTAETPKDKQKEEKIIEKVDLASKKNGATKINLRLLGGAVGLLVIGAICVLAATVLSPMIPFFPGPTKTDLPKTPESTSTQLPPTATQTPLATEIPSDTPTITPTWTPSLTPTPTLGVGSTMTSDDDRMILVYVPAGEFIMGDKAGDALAECQKFRSDCQLDWYKDEEPPHPVYLSAFWLDQTEVTNAMYGKCVNEGGCDPPSSTKSAVRDNYYGNPQFDNYPVVYVSWNNAQAYCSWAGRRLPTEAEWEKAARGENALEYPWGIDGPNRNLLNFDNNIGDLTEVGQYPRGVSPYGALDMAGNAWEWIADWYEADYYSFSPSTNPFGPDSGQLRVLRGGAYYDHYIGIRASYRHKREFALTNQSVGFRCAMSP